MKLFTNIPTSFTRTTRKTTGGRLRIAQNDAEDKPSPRPGNGSAGDSLGTVTEQDALYLAAVEAGDTETVQKMVDGAAEEAGGEIMFRAGSGAVSDDGFLFLAQDADYAANFGNEVDRFYAFPKNTLDLTGWKADAVISHGEFISALQSHGVDTSGLKHNYGEMLQQISQRKEPKGTLARAISAAGFDSVRLNEYVYGAGENESLAMLDAGLVQLAAPVTYDGSRKPIPLSKRFNQ